MNQMSLFLESVPAAAKRDPETSHLAAREINETGARGAQCQMVLAAVVEKPGMTSREIAALFGWDRHMVAKRLPDLEATGQVLKGPPRKCLISGKAALTWYKS